MCGHIYIITFLAKNYCKNVQIQYQAQYLFVIKCCKDISTFKCNLWMLMQSICLSSMTAQICFTIWASVMNIHAFIDATRNQAATKPTSNIKEKIILHITQYKSTCIFIITPKALL